MTAPAGLGLYQALATALGPFAGLWLRARVRRGKEDAGRIGERMGRASVARPQGRLLWLHAASVGEMGVARTLIDAVSAQEELSFLLTTGTRTSADLFAKQPLPRTIHHFVPLDHPRFVSAFLEHWRPDLGVLIESELWPNLIRAARGRGVPLALVNARMNADTLARWRRTPDSARALLGCFDVIFAADQRTAEGLSALSGSSVACIGSLKLAARTSPATLADGDALTRMLRGRPAWLAASTHPGEDEIALAAHAQMRARMPDALLMLAPRHPERGEAVANLAGGAPRRSLGDPIGDAAVYVVDTMGELSAFYGQCRVALVCGSLLPHLTGHNPVEPALAGCAIVSGPHVASFSDLFDALHEAGGAWTVSMANDISGAVQTLLSDETQRQRLTQAAARVSRQGGPALETTVAALIARLRAPANSESARHARA
ncbi:MAG: 3-deoxy-D-manno-octulosonic acid transferase [Alphaproteobacteria bacterium]|nr:3-deoxy-D-manno-octulosonic acid transferase [Alphaproteobacteria bacterium]